MRISQVIILYFFISIITISCESENKEMTNNSIKYFDLNIEKIDTNNFLIRVSDSDNFQLGDQFAFIDKNLDTIISNKNYTGTLTDTLKYFAIVYDHKHGIIGIDRNDQILFEIFKYDNGPDYLKEGYFRIIRNGKIGYANKYGEIKIPCQFECAYPFKNGKAKVAYHCGTIKQYEYNVWKSDDWLYIDKMGNKVDNIENNLPEKIKLISRFNSIEQTADNGFNYCSHEIKPFEKMDTLDCAFKLDQMEYYLRDKYNYDSEGNLSSYWSYKSEGPLIYSKEQLKNDPKFLEYINGNSLSIRISNNQIIESKDTFEIERIFREEKLIFVAKKNEINAKFQIIYQYE